MKKYFILFLSLTLVVGLASVAHATNGYFSHGYSPQNKALAGAGVALPLDSLAAAVNPAGMAFVEKRVDIAISLFNPNREYTVTGSPSGFPGTFGFAPGTFESDSEWFIIPALGANWTLNESSVVGLSVYGNGGMSTDYPTNTYGDFSVSTTGVDLIQLLILPTYARKINPRHAVGISPILAYQSFEQIGLQTLGGFSRDPNNISNNGHDTSYGYGVRIGYMGEVLPDVLYVGASYQTKVYMSELDDYAGLLAEQGDFDIPANWTIGISYKAVPAVIFAFDVQQIYYSDVNSIANPMLPNLQTSLLGNDDGSGFGWDDMTVFKFGVQWQAINDLTLRAGYSYGEQPIPDTEMPFNILAPATIEHHLTLGLTKTVKENQDLTFSLMHGFSNSISGANTLEVPGAQTIELKMSQWEATVGYTWKL